jgi:uncharacterized protein (DUF433 family)
MGGMPCIRALRIPVATVAMVADGMSADEILAAYSDLDREYAYVQKISALRAKYSKPGSKESG